MTSAGPAREPDAADLEVAPSRGRHPMWSLGYRSSRLIVRLVGERRAFALFAELERLLHRLAFESAVRLFGERFTSDVSALDAVALAEIVDGAHSVLDVGCGIGKWCRLVAPHVDVVVGVDHDPEALEIARQRTPHTNVEYRLGDVRDVATGGEPFDVGVLIHVLEHIPDPVTFLDGLHGVVRRIAVEVPDFEADVLNPARLAVGAPFASDADHVREFTERTLVDTLAAGGWKVESTRKRGGAIAVVAS